MNVKRSKDKPERAERMISTLAEAGVRITPARRAVVEVIASSSRMLNSEEVLKQARKRQPSLGLASVYRTLDALQAARCTNHVYLDQQGFVFACFKQEMHAHLICRMCHRLIECDLTDVTPHIGHLLATAGFRPDLKVVEMIGVCESCQES